MTGPCPTNRTPATRSQASRSSAKRAPAWWRTELIRLLYQVRLATTAQLGRLLDIEHTKRVWTVLADLTRTGLVDSVRVQGNGPGSTKAWFLTPAGAQLAETAGDVVHRPYRMTQQAATGPAQAHMLAVTETGCVFVEHARRRGDECRPTDWNVEVAHRTRDGAASRRAADLLISDAVLHYTAVGDGRRRLMTFFLEIDRATMSVARLARKVDHYARYYTYTPGTQGPRDPRRTTGKRRNSSTAPGWRELYPVFPKLLIVLTGAPEEALTARTADLRAWCLGNERLRGLSDQINVGAVALTALQQQGPFTPIVHRLLTPEAGSVDVTMREQP